jgi:hypothetical protein
MLPSLYVLATAEGSPDDYDNRADDEYDAQELEARRIIDPSCHQADDAESDGRDGNEVLHGVSLQGLRYVVGGGGSFRDPLEQVTGLAVEHPAHGIQGAETNSLGTTVLEHRHVRRREPDTLGEFPDAHLAFGQLDVDAHHDGHQITASMSVRSVVACCSSARITTINSPSTVTATDIKNSRSGSPGSSALKPTYNSTPTSTTHAPAIAHDGVHPYEEGVGEGAVVLDQGEQLPGGDDHHLNAQHPKHRHDSRRLPQASRS